MLNTDTKPRILKLLPLTAIIFFGVCGGPYGLDPLLTYVDGNTGLCLLLVVPLFWEVPIIMMILELNSSMPITGGYYQWTKRGLGIRWAFATGWWTCINIFLDLAIYPTFIADYFTNFYPLGKFGEKAIALVCLWVCTLINILGVKSVGRASLILSVFVLIPIALLFGHGAGEIHPVFNNPPNLTGEIGLGLLLIMWNYCGWDNVTTFSDEVARPARSYLIAIGISFVLMICLYFVTILIAKNSGIDPILLESKGLPALGCVINGRGLQDMIALGGMISFLGMMFSAMLSVTRIPEAMSGDHLLPQALNKLHNRFKTPYISILVSAFIITPLVFLDLADLMVMDMTIYFAGICLQFVSLIVLRKEYTAKRLFRIPGNNLTLVALFLSVIAIFGVAIGHAVFTSVKSRTYFLLAVALLLSAAIPWHALKKKANAE